jgi:membrane-bound lytic murein transglycosylase D
VNRLLTLSCAVAIVLAAGLTAEMRPADSGHRVSVPASGGDALAESQGLEGPLLLSAGFDHPDRLDKIRVYFRVAEGRGWLTEGFLRSEPFRDFIVSSLSSYRMPPELYYVAMIESTFKVHAVSSSGAAGMWQFMLNSIGNWMHSNEWVDERYDFWASTMGAMEKLQDNYRALGDWSLALAAYNAGLGKISRIVKKTGARSFWDIQSDPDMPAETRSYVPRIMGAAAIGSQAARNGFPIFWEKPIEWCRIAIPRPLSLSRLEAVAGVPRGVLSIGNAELRYDLTPPGRSHWLKVPRRYLEPVTAVLATGSLMFDYTTHVVAKGETAFSLCRKYRTNLALLSGSNPGILLERLRIGQKLIIPLVPALVSADRANKGADS